MDNLRRRVPFKLTNTVQSDLDDDDGRILDEQEQEHLIQKLRDANRASNEEYVVFLRVILFLSFSLQLMYLFKPMKDNPLFAIFPATSHDPSPSIPLPTITTVLSLVLHLNLAILVFPEETRMRLRISDIDIRPLSYQLSYAIAAVAPTLSIFLRRSWQSTVWWSLTATVVYTVQIVTTSIDRGNESISDLETMKYAASGA